MSHEIIFAEEQIAEFMNALGSSAATPGGGASAALTAAQGVSLISMVCALTVGKEKFAEYETLNQEMLEKTKKMQQQCLEGMDKDAIAFHEMIAVYKMPKGTEEEQEVRRVAQEKALKTCTIPPMELMEIAYEGLYCILAVLGKSNENAVSDLGVAASCFQSALDSSWLNVVINLKGIKDKEFCEKYRSRGKELQEKGSKLATETYNMVLEQIQ